MQRTDTDSSIRCDDLPPPYSPRSCSLPPYSSRRSSSSSTGCGSRSSRLPEHFCSTLAEAFQIIKEQHLCPYDNFEEEYGAVFDSKAAVTEPYLTAFRKALDNLTAKTKSRDYLRRENVKSTVYAGRRFRFRDEYREVGREFREVLETDDEKKRKAFARRLCKFEWRALLSNLNPAHKLRSLTTKSSLAERDQA